MISVVCFAFLVGCVLASGFRAWILLPLAIVTFAISLIVLLGLGYGFGGAFAWSIALAWAPDLGYIAGLSGRHLLLILRRPQHSFAGLKRRRTAGA